MRLNKLTLRDKGLFDEFLNLKTHHLSTYAFVNIYIWRGLFEIYWTLFKDSLCIFFKDKMGCFLYLPPLSRIAKPEVIEETFRIMDRFNKNKELSRIENVEKVELPFYRDLGYECKTKPADYLCLSSDLVNLRGNRFKSKRGSFNYFIKHYKFKYSSFSLTDSKECLQFYKRWQDERRVQNQDSLYQGMLEDSFSSLKVLLDNYPYLEIAGRVVSINEEIKAFSFGFKLNKNTFCILYEITDIAVKGISQFIFREFCRDLKEYKYINIMDDSGLVNLKRAKLSYCPIKLISAYIVTHKKQGRFSSQSKTVPYQGDSLRTS